MLSETQFRKLNQRQKESGLNIKDFCTNEGIAHSTFYYWRKKYNNSRDKNSFIPLIINSTTQSSKHTAVHHQTSAKQYTPIYNEDLLEIVYPNDTRLRVKKDIDLNQLRALICLFQ